MHGFTGAESYYLPSTRDHHEGQTDPLHVHHSITAQGRCLLLSIRNPKTTSADALESSPGQPPNPTCLVKHRPGRIPFISYPNEQEC